MRRRPQFARPAGFLLVLCLATAAVSGAQELGFRTWSEAEGLPQPQVMALLQDGHGFLWMATYGGGLVRFDGHNFVTYGRQDGLVSHVLTALLRDQDGNLWIGGYGGVSRFDGVRFTSWTPDDGLCGDAVETLAETAGGEIWIGARGCVSRYDGSSFTTVELPGTVNWILQDERGHVWIATTQGQGLHRFDGTAFEIYGTADGLPTSGVLSLLEDADGTLWVGTEDGLVRRSGDGFERPAGTEGLAGLQILDVLRGRDGTLWLATDRGAVSWDGRRLRFFRAENGLVDNRVWDLFQDRESNLWFATDGGGAISLQDDAFQTFTTRHGLISDLVMSLARDAEGNLWIGTMSGASRYDGTAFESFGGDEGLTAGWVLDILLATTGELYFGTVDGARIWDGRSFRTLGTADGLPHDSVISFAEDSEGGIWMGTATTVARYAGGDFETYGAADGFDARLVNDIHIDRQGRLWFATHDGVLTYDGKTFTRPAAAELRRQAIAIAEDAAGDLWIGTFGWGLVRYTAASGRVENLTTRDGLSDDNVVFLHFDDEGALWAGTEKGLDKLTAASGHGARSLRSYGSADGFLGHSATQTAVYHDADGSFWFGSPHGAVRYRPERDRRNTVVATPLILGARLFFEEVDWEEYGGTLDPHSGLPIDLTLGHEENHVSFDFVAVSHTAPEKVRYRYQLEGHDKDWSPVTESTTAVYSNVPPGELTFKVLAANDEGQWSEEPATYTFTVRPPFYGTWWFVTLVLGAVVGGVYGGVRIRVRQLELREVQLKRLVAERTEDLGRANRLLAEANRQLAEANESLEGANLELQQRMEIEAKIQHAQKLESLEVLAGGIAHDFNNLLVGVLGNAYLAMSYLEEGSPAYEHVADIHQAGERAAELSRQMLAYSGKGRFVIKPVELSRKIEEMTPLLRVSVSKKIHLRFHLVENLPLVEADPSQLGQVVMNLVTNASEAIGDDSGTITLATGTAESSASEEPPVPSLNGSLGPGLYVYLEITDDGAGMDAETRARIFEPFFTTKFTGRGLGLAAVQGIVRGHRGAIRVRSGPEEGSTLRVFFPQAELAVPAPEPLEVGGEDFRGRGTVLVVDDEKTVQLVAGRMLEELGFRVLTAADGEQGLEVFARHADEIVLVLLDIAMPKMGGEETLTELRRGGAGVRVILTSGFTEQDVAERFDGASVAGFLPKPFSDKSLRTVIRRAFEEVPA